MGLHAVVVVACHFADRDTLCRTTIARLKEAQNLGRQLRLVIVTGNVPFSKGSETLAQLMVRYLRQRGYRGDIRIGEGVGIFSESRLVTESCRELGIVQMIVVASDWYLWAGAPLWRKNARKQQVGVEFRRVSSTGGWRTKTYYAAYALVVRTALLLGLDAAVGEILTRLQARRKESFTFNGCR